MTCFATVFRPKNKSQLLASLTVMYGYFSKRWSRMKYKQLYAIYMEKRKEVNSGSNISRENRDRER